MADQTMAERIMAAADNFGWAMTSWGKFPPGKSASEAAREAEACRATLAALVAEACAPQPERVCRWVYQGERDDWYKQACTGDGYGYVPGVFCPECGGLVELVNAPGASNA